ncbi:MAG: hypothetical protein EOP90_12540 [Lysobacteraceae bacterium]|nr:MAG: hypothetical protein EOP90_12540 [Xanthomonadaceae bacterium]
MDFGYGKFSQDAQVIRNSLVHLDALALNSRYSEHVKVNKALVLVWMSAAVERFWKAYLTDLSTRVIAANSRKRRKNIASASVYFFDTLGSLGDGKKLNRWRRAAEFFENMTSAASSAQSIPYDGRTVRPEHVEIAWQVFCLDGTQFPSPVHKQDLNSLATQRNDVAHGVIDPSVVGGTFTVGDLRVRLERLDDIAIHCVLAAESKWP